MDGDIPKHPRPSQPKTKGSVGPRDVCVDDGAAAILQKLEKKLDSNQKMGDEWEIVGPTPYKHSVSFVSQVPKFHKP